MVGIGKGSGQWITKDGRRVGERDTVLDQVANPFVGVPLKLHAPNISHLN